MVASRLCHDEGKMGVNSGPSRAITGPRAASFTGPYTKWQDIIAALSFKARDRCDKKDRLVAQPLTGVIILGVHSG